MREEKRSERQRERGGGGWQGSFKSENSECTQEALLLATAEDIACRNPKGKPVQTSEY